MRCHRRKPPHRTVVPAALSADLGEPARPLTEASIASKLEVTSSNQLQLIRSFQIPTDDPWYERLLNWSWTYDSAISAAAFVVTGNYSEAEQLLDQLAALQLTNGSIEIAFNVATGEAEPVFRSGTIATVGLAGALYDQYTNSSRYLAMEERAANYLLTLAGPSGLIRGGPDVSWYSTQHNLLAYAFLVHLSAELVKDGQVSTAAPYAAAAARIALAINSSLLVNAISESPYFIEGVENPIQALDTDALGSMYLLSLGQGTVGERVAVTAESAFALSERSIVESSATDTFNLTYSDKGPFSGFKPYIGPGAPNVLWTEGSAEMLLALDLYGQETHTLSKSLHKISTITPNEAPLQADRTEINPAYEEFHVWPAAAAGAWLMLAESNVQLF